MRYLLFIGFVFYLTANGFCHKANVAQYNIYKGDESIFIEANFPWTLRNALIEFDTSLNHSASKIDFLEVLKLYVNTHFKLCDIENHCAQLLSLYETENPHGHGTAIRMEFSKVEIYRIENQLLFNLNGNQQNIHYIKMGLHQIEKTTTPQNPEITIENENQLDHDKNDNSSSIWYFISVILFFIGVYGFQRIRLRNSRIN